MKTRVPSAGWRSSSSDPGVRWPFSAFRPGDRFTLAPNPIPNTDALGSGWAPRIPPLIRGEGAVAAEKRRLCPANPRTRLHILWAVN
jgi:hypothetical protein